MEISKEAVDFIIHHVFLPPKLPHKEDEQVWHKEQHLLSLVHKAAEKFAASLSPVDSNKWQPIINMLQSWLDINADGDTSEVALDAALKGLEAYGSLALHIRAQNAGVIVRRINETRVIVDAFEASPSNKAVMACEGRLIRYFPGRSVCFGAELLQDDNFRNEVSKILRQMTIEIIPDFVPKTVKAGSNMPEIRDTIHPGFVTEAFMNMLEAVGEATEILPIRKHTRDDAVWLSCKLPWKRSPFWLVVKVAIQYSLKFSFPEDTSHAQYKNFMLFLLSELTNLALYRGSVPDVLKVMGAKLGRRSFKMGSTIMEFVSLFTMNTLGAVRALLENSWASIRNQDNCHLSVLEPSFPSDTILSLTNSRDYLSNAMSRNIERPDRESFTPSSLTRLSFCARGLPFLIESDDLYEVVVMLADLEHWVKCKLTTWQSSSNEASDCRALAYLIKHYTQFVKIVYVHNSQEFSVALLTILELWVALDKMCLRLYPLLSSFEPEIPSYFTQSLLLPKLVDMERLLTVELYIDDRKEASNPRNPSVFSASGPRCFAVQYFNIQHQRLLERIENDASSRRTNKEREWQEKHDRYQSLCQQESGLTHDYVLNNNYEEYHSKTCLKCSLSDQSREISIYVDEWPLPDNETTAKSVVFELDCPDGIIAWRDSTWAILHDLGQTQSEDGKNVHMRLFDYTQLRQYATDRGQRITLGSNTKSFLQSHYACHNFPVEKSTVCLNNGLYFQMLDNSDTSSNIWVDDQTSAPSFDRFCVTLLPHGPYSNLQYAANSHIHTQNEVISRQTECSSKLQISEYLAFGSLRAGESIQWVNILRELGSANLSFNESAVFVLLTQAAWQAGSSYATQIRRKTHRILEEGPFCDKLIEMLQRLYRRVEVNWKEQRTMMLIVILSLRVISLTSEDDIRHRAINLVLLVRQTSLQWCRTLDSLLQDSGGGSDDDKLRLLILEAGMICRFTYDLDEEYVEMILNTDEDVANLLESSIMIHDNTPTAFGSLPTELQRFVMHGWKVISSLEPRLCQLVQNSHKGINQALSEIWSGAVFETAWTFMPEKHRSWAINQTLQTAQSSSQTVHYNLMSGELLVDGSPLGRVPKVFEEHPLYRRMFGTRILRVFSSNMPGMCYMTARPIQHQEVHIGMFTDQLIIRTRICEHTLEVIPNDVFQSDIPRHFSQDFAHWLNLRTGDLELRPLTSRWETLAQNWRISFSPDPESPSYMKQPSWNLVDVESPLRQAIVGILQRLDDAENIHVKRKETGEVEIELHRMNIRFFVNEEGLLESRELGAVVDLDQSLGSLYGLTNKLVLQHATSSGRSVLVPFGIVNFQRNQEHIEVSIDGSISDRLRYYRYGLDPHLRKLRSTQGQLSELYLCFLHALTSFVLEDDFTGRTGTEEALTILRGESLHTFSPLDDETNALLKRISDLTPRREFYPDHVEVMQEVFWNEELSPLSQHDEFRLAVKDIVEHTTRFATLYEKVPELPLSDRGSTHLLERASKRHSTFRAHAFGGNVDDTNADVVYQSRDVGSHSKRGNAVYEIAALIKNWPARLNVVTELDDMMATWDTISGYDTPFDPQSLHELLHLSIPDSWGSLYNLCRFGTQGKDTYNFMFRFCPIAFGQRKSLPLIRTLLAFAFSNRFQRIDAPMYPFFKLQKGSCPKTLELEQVFKNHKRPFQYPLDRQFTTPHHRRFYLSETLF